MTRKKVQESQNDSADCAEAVETLQKTEEQYRMLIDHIDEIVYRVETQSNPLQGQLSFLSRHVKNILGYEPEEFMAHPDLWFQSIHPEDVSIVKDLTEQVARRKKTVTRVYRLKRKKAGEYRWLEDRVVPQLDEKDAVIAYFGVARDITERVEAERALRESEEKFHSLFKNMYEGVALHEILYDENGKAADYRILDVNPAYETHTGIKKETAVGKKASELYGTGAPPYLDVYAKVAAAQQPVSFTTAFEPMKKTFRISVISPVHGQFATVFANITAEEEIKRQKEKALTESRHKSEFLANMSHELRTPLNAILGFSELLQDDETLSEKQKEYVGYVYDSGKHLLSLINDILDIAKIEAGRTELEISFVSLKDLLERSLILIKEKAHKHQLKLSLTIKEDTGEIYADERKLKQILYNLLSNAVKFTPDGGAVGIEARRDGDAVTLTVWDTGIGIAKENLERIFQPFSQLENVYSRKYSGTGLGLAITKQLVELHSGTISVISDPEKGSRFTVTLPVKHSRHSPEPSPP